MMRFRPFPLSATLVCASLSTLFSAFTLPAVAQHALLSRHVPDMVRSGRASRVAALAHTQNLELVLSLPLRNQSELDGLLADLYNPQSPNYRHWLQPAEFDARFGPTQADFQALVLWARSNGLTIKEKSANHHILTVTGSVAVINHVFHIEETTYHDHVLNRDFRAPDTEPTTDLDVPLLAISGLDTSNPRTNHLVKKPAELATSRVQAQAAATPKATITGSGPSNTYLPSDMRAAYYGSGALTGTGQNVAIFSYDGYLASDLTAWYKATATSTTVPVTNVLTGGFDGGCELYSPCDDGEQILDILQVQGMAPGLNKIYFYEGLSAVTELNQFVNDNQASIMSSSWGGGDFGPGTAPIFLQMAAQGITYLNATGDSGSFNGFTYLPPSSDPNIVQVGGTDMYTTGKAGPWASEVAWVDSGGGFFDPNIPIPTWQQTPGVINSSNKGSATLRNAPDISAEANFDNSTEINGTFSTGYGGTSYAAPRLAGYLALASQQSVANGNGARFGFINPTLYDLGLRSDAATTYHDITSGTAPASTGTATTYSAVAGYDLVTGWGSPNGAGLINALAGPNFSLTLPTTATVTRGGSTSVALTVGLLNGYTGTPTFTVSGLPTGVTYTLTQNSTSAYTLALTGSSTMPYGTSTVTVTGTSGVITHSASLTLSAIKRTTGDFSLAAQNATVVQMASANSAVTVTAGSGLAAPVVLSLSGLPSGVTASFDNNSTYTSANITFSASIATAPGTYPIVLTGTGAGGTFSHTVILNLTIAPVPSVVVNGGGESGSQSPWTFTSTLSGGVYCTSDCGYYPHSGGSFFYLNGFGAVDTDVLSQSINVTGGSTSATLNFWLFISSAETTTTAKNDTFTVSVTNAAGTSTTLASLSNLNKGTGYVLYSYDMSAFLGQTVTLKFTGVENRSRATAYLLDDISVVVK